MIIFCIGVIDTDFRTNQTPQSEVLPWEVMNGPYEKVNYALALEPENQILYAGTWGHGLYFMSLRSTDEWISSPIALAGGASVRYVKNLEFFSMTAQTQTVYLGAYEQLGLFYKNPKSPIGWSRMGLRKDVEDILPIPDGLNVSLMLATGTGLWSGDPFSLSACLNDYLECALWGNRSYELPFPEPNLSVQTLAYDNKSNRLYAGTEKGLYDSPNLGETWNDIQLSQSSSLTISALSLVTNTESLSSTLFVGTKEAGIYTLTVGARTGVHQALPDELTNCLNQPIEPDDRAHTIQALISLPSGEVYAGTIDHGVYYKDPKQTDWIQIDDGLPCHARSILSFVYDQKSDILYTGTYGDGVYRLRRGQRETTWEPFNQGLPFDFPVQAIAFLGPEEDDLRVALQVGGLYAYTSNLDFKEFPWRRLPKALKIGAQRDVLDIIETQNPKQVFILGRTGGFYSPNGAITSTQKLAGNLEAITQDQSNKDILYTISNCEPTCQPQLYKSIDGGKSWSNPITLSLTTELTTSSITIKSIAVGQDDITLFLGSNEGDVYRLTYDGQSWSQQARIRVANEVIEQLLWTQLSWFSAKWHGDAQTALYARTPKGVYVSYNQGETWSLRLRGFFSDITVNPYQPAYVYAAGENSKIDIPFREEVRLLPDIRVSPDLGQTWTWLGEGPLGNEGDNSNNPNITVLNFNPHKSQIWPLNRYVENSHQLYVGTDGAGIFKLNLSKIIPPRKIGPLGLLMTFLGVMSMVSLGYIIVIGYQYGRPNRLQWYAWPELTLLHLLNRNGLKAISDDQTLKPLEKIIMAMAPVKKFFRPNFFLTSTQENTSPFTEHDIPTDLTEVEGHLDVLTFPYRLLKHPQKAQILSEKFYKLVSPLFRKIAESRYLKPEGQLEKLIAEIRNENEVRKQIRHFLHLAGFETFTFKTGLIIKSNQAEYILLHHQVTASRTTTGEAGIYVHIHTGSALSQITLDTMVETARQAYNDQLAGQMVFLIVDFLPDRDSYRILNNYKQKEHFKVALFHVNYLKQVKGPNEARKILHESLQKAVGRLDLFTHTGVVADPLAFFGHREAQEKIIQAYQQGGSIYLAGLAKVGKTSLARQVLNTLPDTILTAEVNWQNQVDPFALYQTLRKNWLEKAQSKNWETSSIQPINASPSIEDITTDLEYLLKTFQESQGLFIMLDNLNADLPKPLHNLIAAIEQVNQKQNDVKQKISLLTIFETLPLQDAWPSTWAEPIFLHPLNQDEAANLIDILAIQMDLIFTPEDKTALYQSTSGHPLLLRQLISWYLTVQIPAETMPERIKELLKQTDKTNKGRDYETLLSQIIDNLEKQPWLENQSVATQNRLLIQALAISEARGANTNETQDSDG